MRPVKPDGIFSRLAPCFRCMAWHGRQYVLGTNNERWMMLAHLGAGRWRVMRFDAIAREEKQIAADATGDFEFVTPNSRAVLFVFTREG